MDTLMKIAASPLVSDLAQEARFFVYAYNSTTLVTTAGLALGLFFVVTALALYLFYYSSSTGRSGGDWEYDWDNRRQKRGFFNALDLLEKSWLMYDVEEEECRRKITCEAHLSNAQEVNKAVSGLLQEIVRNLSVNLRTFGKNDKTRARELLLAAKYGRETDDCGNYSKKCPHASLATLRQNLRFVKNEGTRIKQ